MGATGATLRPAADRQSAMPDINWGGDSSTAPFSSYLDEANGDLILAKDNSGGTVLLEYDGTTWQYRGPVEMNGEDISGVGTLTATDVTVSGTVDAGAVNAEEAIIANTAARANLSANQTIPTDTVTALDLDGVGFEDETIADVQLSNNHIQVQADGKYHISGAIRWSPSPDWSLGDVINIRLYASGAEIARVSGQHTGVDSALSQTVSISESLTNGDAIEIRVRQDSGGGKEIAGFSNANYLSVARIG